MCVKEVIAEAYKLPTVKALPNACGGKGQHVLTSPGVLSPHLVMHVGLERCIALERKLPLGLSG